MNRVYREKPSRPMVDYLAPPNQLAGGRRENSASTGRIALLRLGLNFRHASQPPPIVPLGMDRD